MIEYSKILSETAVKIPPSGIRKFFDIAAGMKDVISLSIGEPDFKTPYIARKEGIKSLERGTTWYTANAGMSELRDEIAAYMRRRFKVDYSPVDEIMVTVGGSEGIDVCIRSIVEPGDEVLLPEPCFVCYAPVVQLCGGIAVRIPLKAEDHFVLTPGDLKAAITEKTKLLILPFPNNPTGASMSRQQYQAIAEVLKDTDILVLSDEIYAELTYGDEPGSSFASISGMKERTVVINGFSKAYAMTGWRLGFVCAPKDILAVMLKIHQFAIMSAPSTAQYAAIAALKHCSADVEAMRQEYDSRRRLVVDSLNKMGLHCFNPTGAFYVFPDIRSTGFSAEEFCTRLLKEKRVAVVPGTAFGAQGEGFVRISYCYSLEHIIKALEKIREFIGEIK